jgi:hypothetical protein
MKISIERFTPIPQSSRLKTLGIFTLSLVLCIHLLHIFTASEGIYVNRGTVNGDMEYGTERKAGGDSNSGEWKLVNQGGKTEYWNANISVDNEGNEHMEETRYPQIVFVHSLHPCMLLWN